MHGTVSYIILASYLVVWTVVFIKHFRKTGLSAGSVLIFMYVIYAISSLLLYNDQYLGKEYEELGVFPFIYLFLMLLIAMAPCLKYEKSNVKFIQKPSNFVLYVFIFVYGISTIVLLPSNIEKIYSSIGSILSDANSGNDLYLTAAEESLFYKSDSTLSGLYGIFSVIQNFFRDISIFILFYYFSLKDKSKLVVAFLVSILAIDLLVSMANGGRTLFVTMTITIVLAFFLFRNYMEKRTKRIVEFAMIFIFVAGLIPFIAITISRFENTTYGAGSSIISYLGQENLNFNTKIFNAGGIRYGDRVFNQFKMILGFDVPKSFREARIKYSSMTVNDSVFYTFVGDFALDFGPIGGALLISLFSFLFIVITKTHGKKIFFHQLLVIYFVLCVCGQGGMYLFNYSFMNNWIIAAFLFMYFVFYIDYKMCYGHLNYLKKTESGFLVFKRNS